jgi:peptide subunit release factor 1 (eRF1)
MLTRSDLIALAGIDAGTPCVLYAQLDLSPAHQIERTYVVAFDHLVREMETGLDAAALDAARREAARVRQFLVEKAPRGLGLVLYSCEPLGLFRAFYLPEAVPDEVRLERRPPVRTLLDLIDEGERVVAALVDSSHARVLVINQRQVEDYWAIQGLVPGRHRQGGWSQANFQRSRDQAVDVHLRAVCDEIRALDRREPFARLVVGGPPEPLARFQQLLPDPLRQRIAGTFSVEMFQSDPEVVQAALLVARDAERQDEEALVTDLISVARGGGRATIGLDAVLHSLALGAVQRLVVVGGLHIEGQQCRDCGRLVTVVDEHCPACGGPLEPRNDVVEEAIRTSLLTGGEVEMVHGAAAEELLAAGAGIAALLRRHLETQGPIPVSVEAGSIEGH